jgi:hypothetical protein
MGFRIVRVSGRLLAEMFAEGWTCPDQHGHRVRVTKGLPPGADLVRAEVRDCCGAAELVLAFRHPDWPDGPPGETHPEQDVWFTKEMAGCVLEEEMDGARVRLEAPTPEELVRLRDALHPPRPDEPDAPTAVGG